MKRVGLLALAIALVVPGICFASLGTGAVFSLGGDARDLGLAGAGVALADGPGALFTNPAALAWLRGLNVLSAYSDQFGAAGASSLAIAAAGFGFGGVMLDSGPITEELSYRVEGFAVGLGLPLASDLALGGRVRVLHHVFPKEALGWAWDLAFIWRGPVSLGALVEGLLSQPAFPGEEWPRSVSVGAALPLPLSSPLAGSVAFAATGLGAEAPVIRLGVELWAGGLGIRGGFAGGALTFGFSVKWGALDLGWAAEIHPALPTAFEISLRLEF